MSIKNKIKNIARRFGYEISKVGDIDMLESMIYKEYHKDFFFIQIGANNGKRFDPIYNIVKTLKLKGLALEPIKEYYDELVENYKNSNVMPVNKAIYKNNQKLSIYRVKANNSLPEWTKGIASVNPEHFKKSKLDNSQMCEEIVDAVTFNTLLTDYKVLDCDLLQIDTEGYDIEVIKMFPFSQIKPKIIHFEHGLDDGVMSNDDFLEVSRILLDYKYKIIMKKYDCIAYLKV
jgi:FkbM family methyltransferase